MAQRGSGTQALRWVIHEQLFQQGNGPHRGGGELLGTGNCNILNLRHSGSVSTYWACGRRELDFICTGHLQTWWQSAGVERQSKMQRMDGGYGTHPPDMVVGLRGELQTACLRQLRETLHAQQS